MRACSRREGLGVARAAAQPHVVDAAGEGLGRAPRGVTAGADEQRAIVGAARADGRGARGERTVDVQPDLGAVVHAGEMAPAADWQDAGGAARVRDAVRERHGEGNAAVVDDQCALRRVAELRERLPARRAVGAGPQFDRARVGRQRHLRRRDTQARAFAVEGQGAVRRRFVAAERRRRRQREEERDRSDRDTAFVDEQFRSREQLRQRERFGRSGGAPDDERRRRRAAGGHEHVLVVGRERPTGLGLRCQLDVDRMAGGIAAAQRHARGDAAVEPDGVTGAVGDGVVEFDREAGGEP